VVNRRCKIELLIILKSRRGLMLWFVPGMMIGSFMGILLMGVLVVGKRENNLVHDSN
jgi:hypothetical protein